MSRSARIKSLPRTRTFSALDVVRAYARRADHIERIILACFVLGLSTRKVATVLPPILGRCISAGTVSQIAKTLDAVVAAFHRRPVLVAFGLGRDGMKEILDYRLARAESQAHGRLLRPNIHGPHPVRCLQS